jgi:hypothetical protein
LADNVILLPVVARLDKLRPLHSAFHDARGAPAPCEDGTRAEAVSRVLEWLDGSDSAAVFWMYSNARVTTAAIAQSVAMHARQEGILLASYFFPWTVYDGRRDPANLIPTIVYQIALFDEEYMAPITTAIGMDRDIWHKQASWQICTLLQMPFRYHVATSGAPLLIVLNAIDMCDQLDDVQVAQDILLFIKTLACMKLRIRIFITSCSTPAMQWIVRNPDFPKLISYALPYHAQEFEGGTEVGVNMSDRDQGQSFVYED